LEVFEYHLIWLSPSLVHKITGEHFSVTVSNETPPNLPCGTELQQSNRCECLMQFARSSQHIDTGIKLQKKGNQLVVNAQEIWEACRYVQMLKIKGK
jgi:hypothetical protein